MSGAIIALLTVIGQIAGGASGQTIISIISLLEQIIPVLIKEYQDVTPYIKNIIAVLRGNSQVTPEQQASLDALEAKADAEFDAAAVAAQAEDGTTTG